MLTDMFGNEFKYKDYIIYLRDKEPALARIDKIVMSNTNRLICETYSLSGRYVNTVVLKKLDTVEIISEEKASELFPEVYLKLSGR